MVANIDFFNSMAFMRPIIQLISSVRKMFAILNNNYINIMILVYLF